MLPNFFVAGAQKCGTTSIHKYLSGHPDIYLPQIKETKHFAIDDRYEKGMAHYETTFFGAWQGEKAVGEVDPDYLYFETALERISAHLELPGLKFIFIFRNPAERAFSHYLMTYRRGLEPLTFEEAIVKEPERIKKDFHSRMHYSYLDRGFYLRQLKRFSDRVDPSRILLLLSEDLKKNTSETLKTCFDFLEVDPAFKSTEASVQHHRATLPKSMVLVKNIMEKDTPLKKIGRFLVPHKAFRAKIGDFLYKLNQTENKYLTLNEETRKSLCELFGPENEKLAAWMKRDLSHWNR
jgi:hypothetical protein